MTTLQRVAPILLTFAVLFGANTFGRADDSENKNIASAPNRWAFVIDASSVTTEESQKSINEFRNVLIDSGIHEENALVYSASSTDPAKRPTLETLNAIANALRTPDVITLLPGEKEERKIRDSNGVCEVMIFLTGLGVANDETGEAYIAPAGVDEADIASWNDPELFPLKTLEDALLYTENGQDSFERTFFVVALNSPKPATRSASGENSRKLKGVDLTRLPTRGASEDEDEDEDVVKYARYRIATKNARFDDHMVGSFYNTLRDGLEGAADVVGDQSGTVDADELASYLENFAFNAENTVVVVRSGNDEYPICKTQKKLTITTGLFEDIAKTFTNDDYRMERERARAKAVAQNENEKKEANKATKGTTVK